ncbi:hypothetical protein P7K49_028651 [Saguinus oedipus]|uniref:Uncharacterized protein n=1 Tax=Saguinus oedipus TaxID=9490 RepID=A0ABQ9U656_SAGOE|nr:hypothetical protein P7K49_028651 [Saguinus oedipus]
MSSGQTITAQVLQGLQRHAHGRGAEVPSLGTGGGRSQAAEADLTQEMERMLGGTEENPGVLWEQGRGQLQRQSPELSEKDTEDEEVQLASEQLTSKGTSSDVKSTFSSANSSAMES